MSTRRGARPAPPPAPVPPPPATPPPPTVPKAKLTTSCATAQTLSVQLVMITSRARPLTRARVDDARLLRAAALPRHLRERLSHLKEHRLHREEYDRAPALGRRAQACEQVGARLAARGRGGENNPLQPARAQQLEVAHARAAERGRVRCIIAGVRGADEQAALVVARRVQQHTHRRRDRALRPLVRRLGSRALAQIALGGERGSARNRGGRHTSRARRRRSTPCRRARRRRARGARTGRRARGAARGGPSRRAYAGLPRTA
ncbi:hypothetical protein T492DRAFT_1019778, partial [Pavlovales sp. CCMP2436]